MNILQLLSSLNTDISIRAVAAHSKVLKDNNYNAYVYAPLGRELSYFKRWGSKIVGQSSSTSDIIYSKSIIKELCDVVSSKSITILHVYDKAGYKAALQIQKICSIRIIMSLLEKKIRGECNR